MDHFYDLIICLRMTQDVGLDAHSDQIYMNFRWSWLAREISFIQKPELVINLPISVEAYNKFELYSSTVSLSSCTTMKMRGARRKKNDYFLYIPKLILISFKLILD